MPAVSGFTQSPGWRQPGVLEGVEMLRGWDTRGSRLCFHGLQNFHAEEQFWKARQAESHWTDHPMYRQREESRGAMPAHF